MNWQVAYVRRPTLTTIVEHHLLSPRPKEMREAEERRIHSLLEQSQHLPTDINPLDALD